MLILPGNLNPRSPNRMILSPTVAKQSALQVQLFSSCQMVSGHLLLKRWSASLEWPSRISPTTMLLSVCLLMSRTMDGQLLWHRFVVGKHVIQSPNTSRSYWSATGVFSAMLSIGKG
uniref:Uncharacterized protein n=1 Tax=Globisporangium ultimum (strain ATCC 200006 / CBS 805.95 / DAOM BR144) TaxID=431595 RepID=K3WEM1_GLOUD